MENKEFFSIFPTLGYDVFEEKTEKPLGFIWHPSFHFIW
jgi:hypothetical protein